MGNTWSERNSFITGGRGGEKKTYQKIILGIKVGESDWCPLRVKEEMETTGRGRSWRRKIRDILMD